MTLATKWKAAAAGLLTLALLGGSTASAYAAPGDVLNPQPNASEGGLFIFDGMTGDPISDPAHVFDRFDPIIGSGSPTELLGPILGTPANTTASTNAYTFIASEENVRANGVILWNTYTLAGLVGGQAKGANLTPGDSMFGNGTGVDGIFNNVGGTYYMGVAYTKNDGVTVDSAIYRTMTILANNKFTLAPVALEESVTPPTPVAPIEADLAANPGKQVANLVAPVVADATTLTIDAGVANANKTLNVGAYSTYTDLGTVTLDANGQGTVDASVFADNSAHTLVLWEADGTLVGFGTFQMNYVSVLTGSNPVTVDVTTSKKFELIAPAAGTIDLGDVRRNQTTSPVALGQFTVIDDRETKLGWNLNVSANDFVSGANTIGQIALGYNPVAVGALPGGISVGNAKVAGAGVFGTAFSGAAGSSTGEIGQAFNLDLTFKSPIDAPVGTYTSTVSLDLVSK
ncbi:hypothetical protein ACSHWG_05705 [Leucobacter sp. Z1108]|uniref:hypothetical protein n=1 Tax=Leucobacter sp. Z1108 TaxID=3439066 RepID=UPI003F3E63AE